VPKEIDQRIFRFACRAVDVYELLSSRGGASREIARQSLKAATSIGANASDAGAAYSKADFLAKIGIARKECREVIFWLRLIREKTLFSRQDVERDLDEAVQIAAILSALVRRGRESNNRAIAVSP
jgi:four helix bundle protein